MGSGNRRTALRVFFALGVVGLGADLAITMYFVSNGLWSKATTDLLLATGAYLAIVYGLWFAAVFVLRRYPGETGRGRPRYPSMLIAAAVGTFAASLIAPIYALSMGYARPIDAVWLVLQSFPIYGYYLGLGIVARAPRAHAVT